MTPADVREIIRLEMRALRRTLFDNSAYGNHDAQVALDQVRKALDEQFPMSPREYAEEIGDYMIDRAARTWGSDVDCIGERLGANRAPGEDTAGYASRLKRLREELIA